MSQRLHTAFFDDERALLDATRACRARGMPVVDAYSPFPVHGLDEALGIRRSRLPWVCLVAGAAGMTLGLGFQYWASAVDWPLDVGGRPFDSLPAFMVIGFEMTILLAGLATAAALCVRSRLWPGRRWPAGLEATTDAELALVVAESDARFEPGAHRRLLLEHGALRVREEVRA
jgi:hypothetical protein